MMTATKPKECRFKGFSCQKTYVGALWWALLWFDNTEYNKRVSKMEAVNDGNMSSCGFISDIIVNMLLSHQTS